MFQKVVISLSILGLLTLGIIALKNPKPSTPLKVSTMETLTANNGKILLVETAGEFRKGEYVWFQIPEGVSGITLHNKKAS